MALKARQLARACARRTLSGLISTIFTLKSRADKACRSRMMGRDVSTVCDRPFEEVSGTGVEQLSLGLCSSLHSPPSGRRESGELAQLKTARISSA